MNKIEAIIPVTDEQIADYYAFRGEPVPIRVSERLARKDAERREWLNSGPIWRRWWRKHVGPTYWRWRWEAPRRVSHAVRALRGDDCD